LRLKHQIDGALDKRNYIYTITKDLPAATTTLQLLVDMLHLVMAGPLAAVALATFPNPKITLSNGVVMPQISLGKIVKQSAECYG
jgi:hypothetical protein